jgi:hypothetical protein
MKFFVAIAVALLVANCDALFFGKGSGNVQLSGNFHGLGGHPWLGAKSTETVVATEAPVVITEAPVIVPETPTENKGFNIQGQLHGLFKNHKLLSRFHGNKEAAPAPIPEVIEPQPEIAPAAPSKGFNLQGQLLGLLQNHRFLSGSGSGFSLQGNLQGLLKNHRLLAGHFNKNQAPATTEDPFGGDNSGYSVSNGESGFETSGAGDSSSFGGSFDAGISESSSGNAETNVYPEPVAIPEPSPISNDVSSAGLSGSFSASAKGGHNFQKIVG